MNRPRSIIGGAMAARAFGKDHVKGGGCWTARQAMKLGKRAEWHIIPNEAVQS